MLLFCLLIMWADDKEVEFGSPVDPAVWQIRENAEIGCYDAAILEKSVIFHGHQISNWIQIRIFSEFGKKAADAFFLDQYSSKFKGRVVTPDGKEITFSKDDLVEVLAFKTRDEDEKVKILVPPGLTSDCLLEMSWNESAEAGLPVKEHEKRYKAGGPFYTYDANYTIKAGATKGTGPYTVPRFTWSQAVEPIEQVVEKRKGQYISYRNIPPEKYHPYGAEFFDTNNVFLHAYHTFDKYGRTADEFYKNYSRSYLKEILDLGFKRNKEYKEWVKSIKGQLPPEPHNALLFANQAFRLRIQNSNMIPFEKAQELELNQRAQRTQEQETTQAFRQGFGSTWELTQLFYRFLEDLEIPFQIVFTGTVDDPFIPNQLNPYSLALGAPMFAYRSAEQFVMVSPQFSHYSTGFVPSVFQGGAGLIVDPQNKWAAELISIPRFGAKYHFRVREYSGNLSRDGSFSMKCEEYGGGEVEAGYRARLIRLPESEQHEHVRELWEDRLGSSWVVQSAIASNATLDKSPKLIVEASVETEVGPDGRISLFPFPGDTLPLRTPAYFPKPRTQPIFLPLSQNQVDILRLIVPEGAQLIGKQSWEQENDIGKVSFQAVQDGNQVICRRDIVIKNDMLPADQLPNLKKFLAWMGEAGYQSLAISVKE